MKVSPAISGCLEAAWKLVMLLPGRSGGDK